MTKIEDYTLDNAYTFRDFTPAVQTRDKTSLTIKVAPLVKKRLMEYKADNIARSYGHAINMSILENNANRSVLIKINMAINRAVTEKNVNFFKVIFDDMATVEERAYLNALLKGCIKPVTKMGRKYPSKLHEPFWEKSPLEYDLKTLKKLTKPNVRPLYLTTKINITPEMIESVFGKLEFDNIVKEMKFHKDEKRRWTDLLYDERTDLGIISRGIFQETLKAVFIGVTNRIKEIEDEREAKRIKDYRKLYKGVVSKKYYEENRVDLERGKGLVPYKKRGNEA